MCELRSTPKCRVKLYQVGWRVKRDGVHALMILYIHTVWQLVFRVRENLSVNQRSMFCDHDHTHHVPYIVYTLVV